MKNKKTRPFPDQEMPGGASSDADNTALARPEAQKWPEGYVESFRGVPNDFERPAQGRIGPSRTRMR
jgi:hypothetical protein